MCVIVHKPAGVRLMGATLEQCAKANRDGWGIVVRRGDKLAMQRGMMWNSKAYAKMEKELEAHEVALHFRLATHGDVSVENCHPFQAGGGWLLMHNGVCDWAHDSGKRSDTRVLAEDVLAPMLKKDPKWALRTEGSKALEVLGSGGKLLLMHAGHKVVRTGGKWEEHNGCWYSNLHWASHRMVGFGYDAWLHEDEVEDEWSKWSGKGRGRSRSLDDKSGRPENLCDLCAQPMGRGGADLGQGIEVCAECAVDRLEQIARDCGWEGALYGDWSGMAVPEGV